MAVQQILTLTQLSQDRAANTSQVRILWKSTQTGGSHNLTERTARYWVDTGAGETEHTVTYRLNRVSTDTILDTTVTVAHDVSGNGSITVHTWMDTRISAGEVTWCRAKINYTPGEQGRIIWFDLVPGILYSLSMDSSASDEVLLELANELFVPAQDSIG